MGERVASSAVCVGNCLQSASRATNDELIRQQLKRHLSSVYSDDPDTVILDELGLRHGYCRVDLAVVNGSLHGFEIKSDRDTLGRLSRQAETYNMVLDFVTLVTGERHADQALSAAPEWWGIQLAERRWGDGMYFVEVREPSRNPAPDKLAIAKLLWREEALALLVELGAADGFRSKQRRFIYSRLAEAAETDALRMRVRNRLKHRKDWRSGGQRTPGGG